MIEMKTVKVSTLKVV